jgi:hypothetical protein
MKRSRTRSVTLILLSALLVLALVIHPAATASAQDPEVKSAWERVQDAGSYRFLSAVDQTLIPRPIPGMIGQREHRLNSTTQGALQLPDRASAEAPSLALEASAQHPSADPTPTPDAPPPLAGEGVGDTAVPGAIADVPGVSEDWWAAVLEQIRLDLYSLTPEPAEGGPPTYRGHNPDHRFDLTFAAAGVRLARAAEQEASWTWDLRTTGYGYQGDVRPLPAPAETASDANRLEYRRAGMAEWYVNDERGLEQGFTLDAPPAGGGEVLVLEMALDTGLVPTLTSDPAITSGQAIEFTQPDGNVILLRYSDLYAYDAAGRQLPARMEWSGCGRGARTGSCHLQLVIDAAAAAYPLTIDPLIAAPSWAAVGENAGDWFGYSVATAGDVNGDGYADLVVGAPSYDDYRGKAYVYHGSPAGLGHTPAWTAVGENAGDHFGYAVATAGDVNGDGYADLVVGAPSYDDYRGQGLRLPRLGAGPEPHLRLDCHRRRQ